MMAITANMKATTPNANPIRPKSKLHAIKTKLILQSLNAWYLFDPFSWGFLDSSRYIVITVAINIEIKSNIYILGILTLNFE